VCVNSSSQPYTFGTPRTFTLPICVTNNLYVQSNLDDVLALASAAVHRILHASSVFVFIIDTPRNELWTMYRLGADVYMVRCVGLGVGGFVCAWVRMCGFVGVVYLSVCARTMCGFVGSVVNVSVQACACVCVCWRICRDVSYGHLGRSIRQNTRYLRNTRI